MALTYYIRSWDPRSTYPTNPQEGDICYTITKDQTWAPVGGVKKDNIVKEEIYQNGAWVEQGGGGGSVSISVKAVVGSYGMSPEDFVEAVPNVFFAPYNSPFSIESNVIVSIDGTEYECELGGNGADEPYYYGGKPTFGGTPEEFSVDFSVYPFCLALQGTWVYLVPEVPSTLTVVDVIVEDTYDSILPERTTIETGTAVEDEDNPGTYRALLANVGDASELADCYITIGGKTYKIIDDQGSIIFAIGDFYTTLNVTGLEAFIGGDFEIFKCAVDDGSSAYKRMTIGANSIMMGGSVNFLASHGDTIANDEATNDWSKYLPNVKVAEGDIVAIWAKPGVGFNTASFTANPSVTGCTATIITGDANNSYKNNAYRLVRLTNVTNGATLIQGAQFGNT